MLCYNVNGDLFMGKKQILKNIDKNKKGRIKTEQEDNFNKFITTLAGIILLLILGYFLVGVFFTKEIDLGKKKDSDKDTKEEVTIDNKTITAGQIFDKKDSSYYVIVYDFESELTNLSTFISLYSNSENSLPIYKVDSSDKINSNFIVTSGGNTKPTSYDNLKIKSPTLIKIENGNVTSYVEDENQIKSILKNE